MNANADGDGSVGAQSSFAVSEILLNSVDDAILVIGPDFDLKFMNTVARRDFDRADQVSTSSAELLGVIHPDDVDHVVGSITRLVEYPGAKSVIPLRISADAMWSRLEAVATNHLHTPGIEGIVVCFRDRSGEARQQAQNRELKRALDLSVDAVMLHDHAGTLIYANPTARRMINLAPVEIGWPYRPQFTAALVEAILPEARSAGHWSGDMELRDNQNRQRTLSMTVAVIDSDVHEHVLITGRDETERRNVERQTALRADTDPLTRLANRDAFERAVADTLRNRPHVAMLFVDLDRFKAVNDTLGHQHGDEVLLVAASRIRAVADASDVLGRLGGDEFVVLISSEESPEHLMARARAFSRAALSALSKPIPLDAETVYLTASIGIAVGREGLQDPGELLRHADLAMFRAKNSGRNKSVEFTPDLAETATRRMRIQAALHSALKSDGLTVMYQPIVRNVGSTLVGFEALVRWKRDDGSIVPPGEFLEVAEQSDLITEIDTYVMNQACADLAAWSDEIAGLDSITISVNVSSRQLRRHDLADVVAHALDASGLPPNRLVLEVTESSVMEDLDSALESLHTLTQLGVNIAFDDFGTGHCSLGYLRLFKAQILKIDRSFVANASANPEDIQIIKAIWQMAETFGMQTIAEGVETTEQCDLLHTIGCTTMQGFLFDRPLAAVDALARVRDAAARLTN